MEFNQAELEHFRNSQKAHTTKKRESRVWRTLRVWDKFAFFLYAVAFLLLLTSIFSFALPTLFLLIGELGMADLIPASALLFPKGTFIASVLLMLLARYRVLHNRNLRPECGCPVCQKRELIRVPRKRRDRMFSFVGVTAWRYACRNCSWGGLRVGGQKPLPPKKAPRVETETHSLDAAFEEVVYESNLLDATEIAVEVTLLAETPEVEVVEVFSIESMDELQGDGFVKTMPLDVPLEAEIVAIEDASLVNPIDELLANDFVETAVAETLAVDSQEPLVSTEESPSVASDDEYEFDSEFERLCYEVALAK